MCKCHKCQKKGHVQARCAAVHQYQQSKADSSKLANKTYKNWSKRLSAVDEIRDSDADYDVVELPLYGIKVDDTLVEGLKLTILDTMLTHMVFILLRIMSKL